MQNRAVARVQRVSAYNEAVSAYRAGRFDDCLAALNGHGEPQARALQARTLTRLGRTEAALNVCGEVEAALPDAVRGELYLLKALAFARLGRTLEAEETLREARVAAYASRLPALEADYEYVEANLRFCAKELPIADAALQRSLTVAAPVEPPPEGESPYFLPLGIVRARALDLRGLLARTKQGLLAQLDWARLALRELEIHPREDQWLNATLLSNFAAVALEVGEPEFVAELSVRVTVVEWADSMKLQRFNVVRALGWLSALAGDHVGAFREFRSSRELAPSIAWKVESVLDRSFLARELGQHALAEEELGYATELAKQLAPSATSDPFPAFTALVKLAELAAKRDPDEGRALLNRYRSARSKCPTFYFDGMDRGWLAKELVAEATVARAEGRAQMAIDLFVNAFDAYDKLGSRWRAALVALELAEMTEQPFFYGYALRETRRRPQSWLARRLACLSAKQPDLGRL